MKYRPEIDGLRTVAVMAVVLYHAGYALFGGGYVGVDVFFVISGYLITSLIVREVNDSGSFRFGRFYLRRIRRLFPALLCTATVSGVIGFATMSTGALEDFSLSALSAMASASNIYFWMEADYFAADAITKPLLHTWSLSVEEQFYFIWPALTVFLFAKWRTAFVLLAIGALGIASFWLAEQWIVTDRDAAFYLLPARLGEMALGAALVWVEPMVRAEKRANIIKEIGALVGVVLIAWPLFTYDHHTAFPGVNAIMPCIGTALFITFSSARFVAAPMRLDASVFVGKISYSVYLVHWPIIVYWTMLVESEPTAVGKAIMVFLSLVLGWMQYQFIENRFRHGKPGEDFTFAKKAGFAAIPLAALSVAAVAFAGLQWRIPEDRIAQSNDEQRREIIAKYCEQNAPANSFAGQNPDLVTCQNYRGKDNDIYIWGDSHAFHLAPGFARHYSAYNIYVLYQTGCVPHSGFAGFVRKYGGDLERTQACEARNQAALQKLLASDETNIIITSAKGSSPRHVVPALQAITKPLQEKGHNVNVVADFIRPGRSLTRCRAVPNYMISDEELARRCDGVSKASVKELRYNRHLSRLMPEVIPVSDLQCAYGGCKFYHRGEALYRDSHHLNELGSIYFVRKLKQRLNIAKSKKRSAGVALDTEPKG